MGPSPRLAPLYFSAHQQIFGDDWSKSWGIDFSHGQFTGKAVIDQVLEGPLANLLPEAARNPFVQQIQNFVENYSDKQAFATSFAISDNELFVRSKHASPQSQEDVYNQEVQRRLETHGRFIKAMLALRDALRNNTNP
jgi:hypothetical protein